MLLSFVGKIGFFDKKLEAIFAYFDSRKRIRFKEIKTNSKFREKKSGFVDSGFVKTSALLLINLENYAFIQIKIFLGKHFSFNHIGTLQMNMSMSIHVYQMPSMCQIR